MADNLKSYNECSVSREPFSHIGTLKHGYFTRFSQILDIIATFYSATWEIFFIDVFFHSHVEDMVKAANHDKTSRRR